MRHDDHDVIAREVMQRMHQIGLGARVKRRSWFIKYQHLGFAN